MAFPTGSAHRRGLTADDPEGTPPMDGRDRPLPLQHLLLPSLERATVADLYARCHGGAWCSYVDGTVHLPAGSWVELDTYFGGFPVGKWRRHTDVGAVELEVRLAGEVEVEVVLHHPHRATRVVAAERIASLEASTHRLGPFPLADLGDGLLFVRLRAIGSSIFAGGAVLPVGPPPAEVRLGIVITTFNRPDYLGRNMAALRQLFADQPDLARRIRVLVVDNGGNAEVDAGSAPIELVPNRNLGGAGGFARGLMEHRDAGWATHVLFMDDDITFEPDVVARTLAVLSHATDPDLCLAGAMLTEEHPHIQFEAGAEFLTRSVHPFRPIGGGVDLTRPRRLVANDAERPAGYGAWWFFAFPLRLATVNPLPVFVRGDDVLFGLRHTAGHTITLNGVGVWHQQFAQKNGPAAYYYEARNLPLVSLLADDGYRAHHLARRFGYQTMRMLSALKYDTAEAQIAGTRQFLLGPDGWLAIDHEAVNQAVRSHLGERPGRLDPERLAVAVYEPRHKVAHRARGALAAALGGGHAVPRRLSRAPARTLEVSAWSPAATLGREQVVYRYDATGEGYVAERDRDRFRRLVGEVVAVTADIMRNFDRLAAEYRAAYEELTSDKYWLTQFERDGGR